MKDLKYKQYTIKQFLHGDTDRIKYVGYFGLRRDVHRELGYFIFNDPTKDFFIVFDEDKPIAISAINRKDNKISFCSSFVEKEYRGQGIYDFLFNMRINLCKKADLNITGIATESSRSTYLRYGFSIDRETKNYTFFSKEIK